MSDKVMEELRVLRREFERLREQIEKPRSLAVRQSEAADMLSVGLTYLKRLVRLGELSTIRRGRLRLIMVAELQRWLEANARTPVTRVPKTRRKTESEKIRAALRKG